MQASFAPLVRVAGEWKHDEQRDEIGGCGQVPDLRRACDSVFFENRRQPECDGVQAADQAKVPMASA